ncbi:MAG: glutamate--tRNA ligase family protein, partial [Oscillospiraceae bacterium]|nr:glutamate--tRNA ligase family protein [Oscillospiraceae bacterium]
ATSFTDTLFGTVTIDNAEIDDAVLIKSGGMPTYNFANVVDDHLMGITHIIRGAEFLVSTPKYNLLYESFGWETPVYIHVAPVMKDAHRKLSKRHGDPTYEDLLNMGYIRESVLNYVALLGWSPGGEREKYTLDELAGVFSTGGLSKSPAVFDIEKLAWLNGEYLREMSADSFYEHALPYIEKSVKRPVNKRFLAGLLQGRCGALSDVAELTDFIDETPEYDASLYVHKKMKTDQSIAARVLPRILDTLETLMEWTHDNLHAALMGLVAEMELKNGQILYPLRVALSGKASTPGGGVELCVLLGKEESLKRVESAICKLK